jgi:integrase
MAKIYQRDGKYGIDYRDHRGRRIRKLVATDKGVAQRLLSDALSAIEKMRAGILLADPREAKRPYQEHVVAYLSDLRRRGRDEMYRYNVQKHLENAAFQQDWATLKDCTPRSVSSYLRKLSEEGRSAKTVNAHRADLSAFFRWCVREGSLDADPCERVAKSAVSRDKKRRALSVGECKALLQAAPEDRRLVYLVLLYTGLRRSEAAALNWGHVHLDLANAYLELPASITKSGKPESVPLVPEAAAGLREHRDGAEDRDTVFGSIPTMDEFREDLAAAGIAEQDERGRTVVLHSLRHSLATMLAQSKVPPAVAQRIMRHSDIRLTLQWYTDEGLLPTAAAMTMLPRLTGTGN